MRDDDDLRKMLGAHGATSAVTSRTKTWIMDWLTAHIGATDQALARHLRARVAWWMFGSRAPPCGGHAADAVAPRRARFARLFTRRRRECVARPRGALEAHSEPVLRSRHRYTPTSREEPAVTIQWTTALSVGIAELDAQHQEMFRRAGRLLDALTPAAGIDVRPLIEALQGYAVEHFCVEEAWMRDARFPGYVRHKAEHDRFIEDLHALAREHESRGRAAFASLGAAKWLTQWLDEHVSGTDSEMGRFLASRRAS